MPDDLDAETASLRRGWLELGKLIEQDIRSDETGDDAQPGIELAEFGQVLSALPDRTIAAAASMRPGDRVPATPSPAFPRRSHAWSYMLMVAASLLIGVGLAFAFRFFSIASPRPSPTPMSRRVIRRRADRLVAKHWPDDGDG